MERTKREAILLCLVLLLSVSTSAHAGRAIVPDDFYNLRNVDEIDLSPDGNWVAYSLGQLDRKSDKNETHIWMTRYDGAKSVQLTSRAKEKESTPRFSPDGRWLAFISGRSDDKGTDALWLMDRSGGEAQKVTALKGDVLDYAWSPDGKRIALVVADPDPDADDDSKDEDKKPKPIVIDRYRFLEDYVGYLRGQHDHIYILDVATKKAENVTPGPYSEGLPSWSPDGKSIAFVGKRHKNGDRDADYGLFVMAVQKGATPRQIASRYAAGVDAERPDLPNYPAWSPDGKTIAYAHSGDPKLLSYARSDIAAVPAAGGASRSLTPSLDRNAGQPQWSDDGKWVTFQIEDDRTLYFARVPAGGGKIERVAGGRNVVTNFAPARGHTALLIASPVKPAEVFAWDGKTARQITHHNDAWLKQVNIAVPQEISFKSKDGTEVHGFAVRPPGAGNGRLPTILRIHGGPQWQFENDFMLDWQAMAARGYMVVAANPRGSTGRGQAYCAAIYANWGGVDVQDVLAAVDWAVKAGLADPNRLAVGGWSYGGMLTNYVIASDTRFKAATSGASISNILAGYGTDQYTYDYDVELGPPWKNTAAWMKVSYPFLHADRIKTPTIFFGGELDLNVPVRNGMQMYQALKTMNVDTQLVIYPDEYHTISRPSFLKDRLTRYLAWYDKYLKGGGRH